MTNYPKDEVSQPAQMKEESAHSFKKCSEHDLIAEEQKLFRKMKDLMRDEVENLSCDCNRRGFLHAMLTGGAIVAATSAVNTASAQGCCEQNNLFCSPCIFCQDACLEAGETPCENPLCMVFSMTPPGDDDDDDDEPTEPLPLCPGGGLPPGQPLPPPCGEIPKPPPLPPLCYVPKLF